MWGERGTLQDQEQRLAYLFLLVPVTIVFLVIIFPTVWNLWLSFHKLSLRDLRTSAPLSLNFTMYSYLKVFGDPDFTSSLIATLTYSIGGTLITLLLGLGAALLLSPKFRGRGAMRGLFLIPYIAPVVAITFTWRLLLDPRGPIMTALVNVGWLTQPLHLLGQRPLAMITLILFQGWRYFPLAFLFIMARLQAIPRTLYEAADVDGATPFQKFFYITLPQLKLVLATLGLLRFMWTFNRFDDVYLLTSGAAGTKVLPVLVVDYLIGQFDVGAGAAAAMALFGCLTVLLIIYFRLVMRRAEQVEV
ncbi:MAG: sugar ABC transporter permease [Dehalococcoidia bacterium]|nr:sugar ABC transporter permease [Dehalococcoidia bacterium]